MIIDSIPCDLYVDISDCDCMLPNSRLSDALAALLPEQTLMATSKKQALLTDIPAFCQQRSLLLVDHGEADDMLYFLIQLPK